MIKYILYLLCAFAAGWLGHAGGSGYHPRWFRIIGVPLMSCLNLYICGVHNTIVLLITFGLLTMSISTYWDFLTDGRYDIFWMHGFILGLSYIFIYVVFGNLDIFIIRSIALGMFVEIWHHYRPNIFFRWDGARIEEFGRYFATAL